jgi:arsenite methyltransferase
MTDNSSSKTREYVRKQYGNLAKGIFQTLKESNLSPCCGDPSRIKEQLSKMMGYSKEDLDSTPKEANLGLGCGNPKAIASLKPGETVLDLGSGGGFDCFLAAKEVGPAGKVIGVDMTPEMVSKARKNASTTKATNVEFRLGEIEHLPVADSSVDVIISNCVINLSPEKPKVTREMFRVLKPGGRLAISDMVALKPLPEKIKKNLDMVSGCVGNTETVEHIEHFLKESGFQLIRIKPSEDSRTFIKEWFPGQKLEEYVASATIEAVKPDL